MPELITQPDGTPTRKVTAYAIGASVAAILVWVLSETAGAQPPPGIEGAIATLIGGIVAWFVRERAASQVEEPATTE